MNNSSLNLHDVASVRAERGGSESYTWTKLYITGVDGSRFDLTLFGADKALVAIDVPDETRPLAWLAEPAS